MVAEFCCSLKPGLSGPRRMLLSPRQACCPKTQCTAGGLWRALLPPFGEHTFIQKKNTDRVSMCQRRNSKSQLGFPTWKEEGRVGQQRCLQTSSGPVWKSKACSESRAREGHKEAHLNPVQEDFQLLLLHCPQNGLHSIVMSSLSLERFKLKLNSSF